MRLEATTDRLTVGIIIRARNEAEHLPRLLAAIAVQSLVPDEIIVVDSGSSDGTDVIAQEFGGRLVRIEPERFSFGRSLNIGCSEAHSHILVIASAHVYPSDEKWLELLVAPFARDSNLALSYGRQTGDARTHHSEHEIMRRWFPTSSDDDQRIPFCNNANCAIRKSVWEQLPYDESLSGLEDLDWAARALNAGYRIAYVAEAGVVHIHRQSFSMIVERYLREAMAYRRIFLDERFPMPLAVGLFGANVCRDYLSATRRAVLLKNLFEIPRFRSAQFWGAYLGFRHESVVRARLKRRFYYPKGVGNWRRTK